MDAFETLAEISVGLAGFGTITNVLAFDRARWGSAEYYRSAGFFTSSLGAVFLALLVIGLGTTSLTPPGVWRGASIATAIYLSIFMVSTLRLRRRHLDRTLYLGPLMMGLASVALVAALAAQVTNALGLLAPPGPTAPFFGVVCLLAYACLMLVRMVFTPPDPR